jgi:hypothetical protein
VVPVQTRNERRLRCHRMGGQAALRQRQGRAVWRILPRRHANARRDFLGAEPGCDLSRDYRIQLPCALGLSGRRIHAGLGSGLGWRPFRSTSRAAR